MKTFVDLTNDTSEKGPYYPTVLRTMSDTKRIFNEHGFFSKEGGRFLIENKASEIVGDISFFKLAHYLEGYEIGYQIYKEQHRGKGYTSEALILFSAFLFDYFPINRLQICMEKDNIASEKVAQNCGYIYEGQMRNAWTVGGKVINNQVYSMIREEALKLSSLLK